MNLPAENRKFTYRDYLTWPDDLHCELMDGEVYDMSPAPGNPIKKP